jgi:curved DNA-binding protein CbpA
MNPDYVTMAQARLRTVCGAASVTFDPYQVLGLDRDADAPAIKRAYRKRAKQAHPDAGGSAEAFARLARANLVLSDPARRSRYNRDGTVDDSAADSAVSKAISIVVGFFAAAVENHIRSGAPDPLTVDLVRQARGNFAGEIRKYQKQRKPIVRAREKLEAVEKRLRAKKNANLLLRQALRMQAASTAGPLANIDSHIAAYRCALAVLDGYDYVADELRARPRKGKRGQTSENREPTTPHIVDQAVKQSSEHPGSLRESGDLRVAPLRTPDLRLNAVRLLRRLRFKIFGVKGSQPSQ